MHSFLPGSWESLLTHFEVVPASEAYACFDPTSKTNLPESHFTKTHVAKYSTETKSLQCLLGEI